MAAPPARVHEMVHTVLDSGRGRRLILCPSSGYTESVFPDDAEIQNWFTFINEGVRYAETLANG